MQAWAVAALEGGELWVGALPPDVALSLPEGWRVLGATRQGEDPAFAMESVWLELPPLAPDEAGRQVMRLLARAGWREPLGDRLVRRLVGLFGARPPGFLPLGFMPPEDSPVLPLGGDCLVPGAYLAHLTLQTERTPEAVRALFGAQLKDQGWCCGPARGSSHPWRKCAGRCSVSPPRPAGRRFPWTGHWDGSCSRASDG